MIIFFGELKKNRLRLEPFIVLQQLIFIHKEEEYCVFFS